jgi:hypothetical protein
MVLIKAVVIVTLIAYFLTLAGTVAYAYYYLLLDAAGWIQLFILLVALGVFMLEGLGQILKTLKQPKLKIVQSYVKPENEGAEGEYKDIYLMVRNIGHDQAIDFQIMAEAKGISKSPYYIAHNLSLGTFPDKHILFQRIIKSTQETQSLSDGSPILAIGKVYEYKIWFCGGNLDKRSQRLMLNLSSWEGIAVRLDC